MTLFPILEIQWLGHLVFFRPGLVQNENRVEVLQEDRIHRLKVEFDGQVVDFLRLTQHRGVGGDP